jgi:hypothetical protein
LHGYERAGIGTGTGPPAGIGGGAGAHSGLGMPSGSQRPSSAGMPGGVSGKGAHAGPISSAAAPLGPKSPIDLLQQNTKLAANLAKLFPEGTDLTAQAQGFKNLGQFVSAAHVSHNLGIPFNDLKCAELGTSAATASGTMCSSSITNQGPTSLGKSIASLRPGADAQEAIKEANRQVEKDFKDEGATEVRN